jgi:tetratricopeptide (TPR) repeat protein
MSTTNEKSGNDRRPRDGSVFVRLRLIASPGRVQCGWLRVFACVLIVVSFGCKAVCSEINIDELDPTSLLATESAQNDDEEIGLPAIQMPPQPDFNTPQPIVTLATNFAAAVKDELPRTSPPPADVPARQSELQLRKSIVSPPSQRRDNSKTDDLRQMIEQIRSVTFESQQPAQQPVNTAPDISPEPNITPAVEPVTQPVSVSAPPEAPDKSMSGQTLQTVQHLLKGPNHIATPLELAEILYRSGELGLAGLCYKQALSSIAADDPNWAGERAWILFQIGNCLKDNDPNAARESYAELVRTHPDSPWAEIAKSENSLADWYQQDQPHKLIQELNRESHKQMEYYK